jgi:hypothetical protein
MRKQLYIAFILILGFITLLQAQCQNLLEQLEEIASSNFPRFDRNLNSGGNNYDEPEGVTATNTINHWVEHPSKIIMPIVNQN